MRNCEGGASKAGDTWPTDMSTPAASKRAALVAGSRRCDNKRDGKRAASSSASVFSQTSHRCTRNWSRSVAHTAHTILPSLRRSCCTYPTATTRTTKQFIATAAKSVCPDLPARGLLAKRMPPATRDSRRCPEPFWLQGGDARGYIPGAVLSAETPSPSSWLGSAPLDPRRIPRSEPAAISDPLGLRSP